MTKTQNVEPLIEQYDWEARDSGIPSTVAILGHPLHPLIVTFPIAFLVGVSATDLVYFFTRDDFWARASFWLIAGGIATGLMAALTGMLDFLKIRRVRERKAGWIHMIGNVAALGLSVVNLVLRWNNITNAVVPTGLILSILVSGLLGVTGWYGAELVYRHKIAVVGESSSQQP